MSVVQHLPIREEAYRLDQLTWVRDNATLMSAGGRFRIRRVRHAGQVAWLLYDDNRTITETGTDDSPPHHFTRQRDAKEHAAYITTGERLRAAGLASLEAPAWRLRFLWHHRMTMAPDQESGDTQHSRVQPEGDTQHQPWPRPPEDNNDQDAGRVSRPAGVASGA